MSAVWTIPSASRPGLAHQVTREEDGSLSCTCESFQYRRMCRHLALYADTLKENPMTVPATIPTTSLLPSASDWATLRSMAQVAIESGLLPPHVKSEQAALFIAMKGRELTIPTTYAWSNIAVISGKPVCSAELMLALIYRDHGGQAIQFEETTDDVCRVTYQRAGVAERRLFAFTIAQAGKAGLTGGNWQKYPAAMLRARCVSAVARMAFADSIAGMYTPEELGAAVTVTPDGEVVMTSEPEPPTTITQQGSAPIARVADPPRPAEPDPELDAARAALKAARVAHDWSLQRVVETANWVWPHITSAADLGTLTPIQLTRLTEVVTGESVIHLDTHGTRRIMPAEVLGRAS
jgi:hypothetical protein